MKSQHRLPSILCRNLLPAMTLCSLFLAGREAHAQLINYEWTGNTSNDWATRTNWTPDPGAVAIGTTAGTRFYRVTINGDVSVTRTGDVAFYNGGTPPTSGTDITATAVTLSGGADLSISGNLRITSSSGGYVRNASIGSGSTLDISGSLSAGAQNATGADSTWTIGGIVNTGSFLGFKSTSTTEAIGGGFVLNIAAGSLNVTNDFNWRSNTTAVNLATVGHINLTLGGTVNVGSFTNWDTSNNNFVNFADNTGSLTFGKTGYDLTDVQNLIDGNYIRKGLGEGAFNIQDGGTNWIVTVVPEPTTAALCLLGPLALLLRRQRRMCQNSSFPVQ